LNLSTGFRRKKIDPVMLELLVFASLASKEQVRKREQALFPETILCQKMANVNLYLVVH